IFKATSNHKYDTTDYFEIDPDFGDKETLRKLVDEAHKRGIRIMLDAVFNHLGMLSHQWTDVVKNEEKSKYADWFHIHKFPVKIDDTLTTEELENVGQVPYDTFAFTGHMPKLNTANKDVQDYLLEVAAYWIREFDIDAWRLDVANEVDHHFWKRFYQVTTDLKEDFYILGEIWHSSQSWLQGDEFHAVMNYAFTGTIEDYFMNKRMTASKMVSGLNEQLMLYRQQANEVMFNSLDSHDTARILTISAGNKDSVKSSLLFTFMQHGSPCIYYGTEVGMDGFDDPDCRKCMVWDKDEQDLAMLDFSKKLIAFRKEHQEILSYGKLDWFDVRDDDNVVGFKRSFGEDVLVAYFNQGEEDLEVSIDTKSIVLLSHLVDTEKVVLTIKKNGFVVFKK
ncbi:glycoside hydrolase family 13 protein, partial [Carnobacterium sp.]|uniref:glycoside hydrolase family 13 protein n=1 Tax=Carnobacterium sp. TaxID=48221 RepID=UPI003C70689F